MTARYRIEALARVRRVESWASILGAAGLELRDSLACLCRAAGLAAEYAHTSAPSLAEGDWDAARRIVREDGTLLCDGLSTGRCGIAVASLSCALAALDALHPSPPQHNVATGADAAGLQVTGVNASDPAGTRQLSIPGSGL